MPDIGGGGGGGVITEWALLSANGVLCIKALRRCDFTASGVHEPKDN